MAPRRCRSTNRQAEPEVWFRIVHIAQEGHNSGPVAAYREQTVEIALGPKGAFEKANIGALTRRVVELLRKAIDANYRGQLREFHKRLV